jgi:hypothetical protein
VRGFFALPAAVKLVPLAGIVSLAAIFLTVALWNGFPLVFYDTDGYLAEGLAGAFLPERAPVYSLLLFVFGAGFSFWLVAALQAAMTAFMVTETARAEVPGLSLGGLMFIGLALALTTGICWYVGQIEPDCMTPLVVLGCYLLLFRGGDMSRARRLSVFAVTALAVACHPSHPGLMAGLLIAALLLAGARRLRPALPRPRLLRAAGSMAAALVLILAANYGLARGVFISHAGPAFLVARLMQDGIVKRLLDDTCPRSGYRLCAWRTRLKTSADAWLWSPDSGFRALGGFSARQQRAEDMRIILDSLERYPLMQVRTALRDSALQFVSFKTGDGIEPQLAVLEAGLKQLVPGQLHAYLAARQQRSLLRFRDLNLVHVPVGALAILGVLWLLWRAARRRRWEKACLPALVLLALIGNAIICGTFAGPHDRYQSRLIWLPVLTLILAGMRELRVPRAETAALRPAGESVT